MIEESYFQKLNRMEEENFQRNCGQYPEQFILLEDCETAYRFLLNNVISIRTAKREESHFVECMMLSMDITNELCLATLALFREHLDDSHYHLRKALELCGSIYLISNNPEDVKKWKEAGEDDVRYKEFSKAFRTWNLFPNEDEGMNLLYEQYAQSSKYLHSSIFSVHSHLKSSGSGINKQIHGGAFTSDLPSLLFKQQCVAIAMSHALILMTLKKVFDNFLIIKLVPQFEDQVLSLKRRLHKLNDEVNDGFDI